ncbi:M23 family metallopeptidase [Paenibacillus cremeus]|uniref:M23 family metallopeptidase n=1 Tax=Paenibacillus cremeus TaxID=2163881 RepID=A0A559KF21_9BACL|nr:M23 family metallopeptidase [Paenibacillus cremeus]TVY10723.1 M23 family metallopeptidase [Paenibacillus cremeus]
MNFNTITDRMKSVLSKLRSKPSEVTSENKEQQPALPAVPKERVKFTYEGMKSQLLLKKWVIAKSVTTLGVITAVVWAGNHYVHANMVDYYHVIVNGQDVGSVSDEGKVEQYKEAMKQKLAQSSADVQMAVQAPKIEFTREKAFMVKTNDEVVLDKLNGYFSAHPVGVQLMVDGKPMGILKDNSTAQKVLDQIKSEAVASLQKKKESGKVGILSASAAPANTVAESELLKADFVQKVEMKEVPIEASELNKPEDVQKKLETGDVQPTKYTVEQGDCVSCIAKKLDIPKQVIYQNNPSINNDMIKVGQQLDLTVLQPTLAVRTVEKVVENQEIQYDTEYQQDASMRVGVTQVISPGKNGMKKVTVELTKVNGLLEEEKVLDENITQDPVKAVVKRGTKVVLGEGSGKFAWPVVGATITSTFGTRWGAFHKGVDLAGNRNIMAADNGKVVYTGYKSDYGNHIIIDHMNGYRTLYGHLSQINTSVGKIVEKGESIGIMGSTGDSTGVHLHFEVQKNGAPDNPLKYLNR